MSQQKLDLLYGNIYIQSIRYEYFKALKTQGQWNSKTTDEFCIFKKLIDEYRKIFSKQVREITKLVINLNESNLTSYFTLNLDFYKKQNIVYMEEIKAYSDILDSLNIDNVMTTDLKSLGHELDILYPNIINVPTLFGTLVEDIDVKM